MTKETGRIPNEEPLAYFLTWTAYGTWLPGDERGWFAKPGQFRSPDPERHRAACRLMTESPVTLDPQQRRCVEATIVDHCRIRGWHLHAAICCTQHVHVVLTAPLRHPTVVLDQFKAWCTRRLKELECKGGATPHRQKWWTQGGSKRWINDQQSLEDAIRYVREGQGLATMPLPDFSAKDTQA